MTYLVYGDYSIERKGFDEFRNDMKILGFIEANSKDEAIAKLIEECGIDDINDIEDNKVFIVEYKKETLEVIDLESL